MMINRYCNDDSSQELIASIILNTSTHPRASDPEATRLDYHRYKQSGLVVNFDTALINNHVTYFNC